MLHTHMYDCVWPQMPQAILSHPALPSSPPSPPNAERIMCRYVHPRSCECYQNLSFPQGAAICGSRPLGARISEPVFFHSRFGKNGDLLAIMWAGAGLHEDDATIQAKFIPFTLAQGPASPNSGLRQHCGNIQETTANHDEAQSPSPIHSPPFVFRLSISSSSRVQLSSAQLDLGARSVENPRRSPSPSCGAAPPRRTPARGLAVRRLRPPPS